MSVVRRDGEWRLERSTEGVYLITNRGRVRTKVVTADYVPTGSSDERNDRSIPMREVSSIAEVEHVFTSVANGDAFVPVPAQVTRSRAATPHDTFRDLPLGGIAFVGLLAGGCFASLYATALHPILFAVGVVSVLVGAVVAGVGYRKYRQAGLSPVVDRLHSLNVAGEKSHAEELAE